MRYSRVFLVVWLTSSPLPVTVFIAASLLNKNGSTLVRRIVDGSTQDEGINFPLRSPLHIIRRTPIVSECMYEVAVEYNSYTSAILDLGH